MTTTNAFETPRFGVIEYLDDDVVSFREGLVGLPDLQRFLLLQHKPGSPFRWLQSLDRAEVALLVVDPVEFVNGYEPEMPATAAVALGLDDETPRLVYTVVTIPSGRPQGMTLNLAGPIVVNAETRNARQVVLEDEAYPVKFPVMETESQAA